MSDVDKEHSQNLTIHIVETFPPHTPRKNDPHYHIFNACRKKLKAAGKLLCWVCGKDEKSSGAPIELHHALVEFALANGIDVHKFALDHPQFNLDDDESFFAFIEGPDNLLALCVSGESLVWMADDEQRPMSHVQVEDFVISHDLQPHQVRHKWERLHEGEMMKIDDLDVTPEHLLLTEDGWRAASKLRVHDKLFHFKPVPQWIPINKITRYFTSQMVYDIEVEDSHSFFAGGVAVHNCVEHHRGIHAIHGLPGPTWDNLKYEKSGEAAFGEVVHPTKAIVVDVPPDVVVTSEVKGT